MKLVTKEIEREFKKYPLGSQDGKGDDALVILKVFNPYGSQTWLITEAEKDGDDWYCFGCANLFGFWEWGYISINELANTKVNVFGFKMGLERDMYCKGKTVRDLKEV